MPFDTNDGDGSNGSNGSNDSNDSNGSSVPVSASGATEIDAYFAHKPSPLERAQTAAALRLALRGCRLEPTRPQAWGPVRHPQLDEISVLEPAPSQVAGAVDPARDVVVSTVRMGYGHHRIALGVCSHAAMHDRRALLLDLLASPRDEARAIKRMDGVYSLMSRLSAELGGPFEALWGRMMTSGGVGAARLVARMASHLDALLADIPRDVPFISAYPLNGHLAVRLGFKRVVNLIFDNDPQPFLIVPGALNLVQTTSSLERLRLLGVPRHEVELGGHWVARGLLEHLEADTAARTARAQANAPRRLLVAIGGAGAQRKFVFAYLAALRPLLEQGRARVMLNLGDHAHLRAPCARLLEGMGLRSESVHGAEALAAFEVGAPLAEGSAAADERLPAVTVFSFDKHFDAVRATDRLLRCADVLVTKPSELAFVPVPKLHIRRVGDHEAASARRSAELGDGSLECRDVADAVRLTHLFSEGPELVVPMNARIVENARRGVYSGADVAVKRALTLPG